MERTSIDSGGDGSIHGVMWSVVVAFVGLEHNGNYALNCVLPNIFLFRVNLRQVRAACRHLAVGCPRYVSARRIKVGSTRDNSRVGPTLTIPAVTLTPHVLHR
ncbi:hypothetical protein Fot_08078 [Forsythia ovata]|uniref:Uncharacterized protein n=1 Tax=Forsythia ovata TaxID=205694 RepID=A0ABD1WXM1_9LAMI